MRITHKQLKLFIAVAERENITQASLAIFLSQPAASMTLQELEAQLGEPLFDRIGKKLVLNKNGLQLYPKAVEVIDRVHQIENMFKSKGEGTELSGCLKIGASSTIGNYRMPALMAKFIQKYPQIKIIQKISNSQEIIQDLEKFKLDIGFIETQCSSDTLEITPWEKDELVVFSSPKHFLAQKILSENNDSHDNSNNTMQNKSLTLQDIEQVNWIFREVGSGTREILEKYIRPQNIILEVGSTQAIKQMVSENLGISSASRSSLLKEFAANELVELPIKNLVIQRDFLRLIHKKRYKTALINAFLDMENNPMLPPIKQAL